MKDLIDNITNALLHSGDLTQTLLDSDTLWKHNYPIAIVHDYSRIKSSAAKALFGPLIDNDGKTPEHYSDETLESIRLEAPESIQWAKLLALKHEPMQPVRYKAKYPKDFWKKIQDVEHIRASFDYCQFEEEADICKVEFELREIIRKRKEVHAFKGLGFIWMAISSQDLSKVFRHYFSENYQLIDDRYHLGWSESLKAINMRYFVCPPK